jgi:hypothetical protein
VSDSRHQISFAFTLLALLGSVAEPASAALSATVGNSTLRITGTSPNARIAICGYGQTYVDGVETFTKETSILSAATDGTANLSISQPAFRSVWLVVDLAADAYVVATPPQYEPQPMPRAPIATGNIAAEAVFKQNIELCVVRSPLGAWTGSAVDGTPSDDDGTLNGRVGLNLRRLTPVGDTPPGPPLFLSRDIVFAVDQAWMQCSIVRIP